MTDLRGTSPWKRWFRSLTSFFPMNSRRLAPEPEPSHFNLSTCRLKDIMVPRTDILAVNDKLTLAEIRSLFLKTRFHALPVFKNKLDHIEGWIDIHTLFEDTDIPWTEQIKPVFFAAASMSILEAILEIQQRKLPFILVVDEYGGVDGLISRESMLGALIEHLKLFDHPEERETVSYQEDGAPLLDARIRIESLLTILGPGIAPLIKEVAEEIETVGGLVCHIAGRVPMKGEVIRHHPSGLVCEIIDADPRHVKRLSVRMQPQDSRPEAAHGETQTA